MYLEQQNYKKSSIQEVQKEQKNVDFPIINGGYPTFNTCDHTTLDLSGLESGSEDNSMHTLSIKLPNDRYITVCVMNLGSPSEQISIDTKFHGEGKSKAMRFENGIENRVMNDTSIVALIHDKK